MQLSLLSYLIYLTLTCCINFCSLDCDPKKMANAIQPIKSITASTDRWSLNVRVIRLWMFCTNKAPNSPISMEMVLQDEEGKKIHASVQKTLIYKFKPLLKENGTYNMFYFRVAENTGNYKTTTHQYRLNFQYETEIKVIGGCSIPYGELSFTPIRSILDGVCNADFLVDVAGVISSVGQEKEIGPNGAKGKMLLFELAVEGSKIGCALFDGYVDEFNAFVGGGDTQNVVLVIQYAKIHKYKEKVSLQNIRGGTKLFFNCQHPEAVEIRDRYIQTLDFPSQPLSQMITYTEPSLYDDMLVDNPRKVIAELTDMNKDSNCIVRATIRHIQPGKGWWYLACVIDGRSVYPDSSMYYCERCDKHVFNVAPRFRVKMKVVDETDSNTFILFDRNATAFFKKSCPEMVDSMEQAVEGVQLPQELMNLVDKVFLFKIKKEEMNPNFGPSYAIKRMTSDPILIEKFEEIYPKKNLIDELSQINVGSPLSTATLSISASKRSSEETLDLSLEGSSTASSKCKKLKALELSPKKIRDLIRVEFKLPDTPSNNMSHSDALMDSSHSKTDEVCVSVGDASTVVLKSIKKEKP